LQHWSALQARPLFLRPSPHLTTGLPASQGLEISEPGTRAALLAFTMHMAAGREDAALKAMRRVSDGAVWASMAAVCVKTGKLAVLELCLANMENVRGARALREQQVRGAGRQCGRVYAFLETLRRMPCFGSVRLRLALPLSQLLGAQLRVRA